MTGRRPTARGEEFTVPDSEYADDTALPFCSRADLDAQTPRVCAHFKRWGMEVHEGVLDEAGKVAKESKSEVLFCSAPLHMYADAGTFDGADLSQVLLPNRRCMRIVTEFPYLGDIVARDGGDGTAVDRRISAASKAFGALRKCIFASSSVNAGAKRAVYESIVLSILLYGCESWCLTETHRSRLRTFHAQSLRAMCRVTRKHTWQHHISTQELGQRLRLELIDTYIDRHQLR
uniref:Reverse transcriptase domain-containing protein n=1 Tax=Coccolithus braarudii TaxID=221442 RepID=A0A7S0LG95_9EUKA|mmetsp:Transcript_38924/g.82943  ORF Transcript_38924/g.82943 Transcript_38924/m.82943 type:complete len:233 (+) Transcript_38924:511-1209(+)